MPVAPSSLCNHPGCRIIGKHYHGSKSRPSSSAKQGYDYHWQLIRKAGLAEEPLCRICYEVRGRVVAATQRDHIIPKTRGGTDHPSNLQSLCKPCNSAKGNRDNEEFRESIKRELQRGNG